MNRWRKRSIRNLPSCEKRCERNMTYMYLHCCDWTARWKPRRIFQAYTPHTCNTDATWCKLFKSTHQSKDPDQENACSQVTATTASPYNNRHSCSSYRSEKRTQTVRFPKSGGGLHTQFRPIRSCLRLHVLKGLRITAKNKDYVIH